MPKSRRFTQKQPKKLRSYLPAPQIVRIQQRHISGEKNSSIARAEGCDRHTVARIVKSSEMVAFVQQMRERLYGLAPLALDAVEHGLNSKDTRSGGKEIKTSAEFSTQAAATTTPDATSLSCDKPTGTTVACHLVGKNLKSVTQLKLEPSAGNPIASTKFEPDVTDETKGTATFGKTDFAGLKPGEKYTLVLVSGGKDIKSSAEFTPQAAAPVASASSLTCTPPQAKAPSATCQLVGKNLQLIKQLKLVPKSGKSVSSSKFEPDATHAKANVAFNGLDFSSLTKGQSYAITLVTKTGGEIQTSATYKP